MTVDKSTDDAHKIKEVMRIVGTPQIQLQLAKYIKQLKEGILLYSQTWSNSHLFKSSTCIKEPV